jgi:PAS domain-containing protein
MGAQPNILRASNGETRPNALDDVYGPSREVIEALPAALYMTDAEGRITFYKEAGSVLWGCHPEVGDSKFSGS